MSWLTELKQEAETVKARTASVARAGQLTPAGVRALQSPMRALERYFTELADQLNVLNPDVRHSFDVLGYARLPELRQGKYRCRTKATDAIMKVTFDFECIGKPAVQFWVDTHDESVVAKERLFKHRLHFRWKDDEKWRYVFTLQPNVPVSFEFEPYDEGAIKLTVMNYEHLGTTTYTFDAGKITDEFMDELGKRIAGRPNRFAELSGCQVSNDIRKQFQEKIMARQREREAELGGDGGARDSAKLSGRLSKLFRKEETEGSDDRVSGERGSPPSVAPRATADHEPTTRARYTWMVTGSADGDQTSDFVGRIGPSGAAQAGIKALIERGSHFRMRDESGNVRYTGYILGECSGREPLDEYGKQRGCTRIEYEREGKWAVG